MNKKLLTGAALAAAGVAATYLWKRKRSASGSSQSMQNTSSQGRSSSKHMTDVFSNAKSASQSQAWSPARDESL